MNRAPFNKCHPEVCRFEAFEGLVFNGHGQMSWGWHCDNCGLGVSGLRTREEARHSAREHVKIDVLALAE